MKSRAFIGQLDRRIEIYKMQPQKTSTGEVVNTPILHKATWARADDKAGRELEEGKLFLYAIRNYTIRFDAEVMANGEKMFIRDLDGDYYITAIDLIGRREYITLKTLKRE